MTVSYNLHHFSPSYVKLLNKMIFYKDFFSFIVTNITGLGLKMDTFEIEDHLSWNPISTRDVLINFQSK